MVANSGVTSQYPKCDVILCAPKWIVLWTYGKSFDYTLNTRMYINDSHESVHLNNAKSFESLCIIWRFRWNAVG